MSDIREQRPADEWDDDECEEWANFDLDWSEDEDDEDLETACVNCLRQTCGDSCEECGMPLCHMCTELGANFCDKCPTENYHPLGDFKEESDA